MTTTSPDIATRAATRARSIATAEATFASAAMKPVPAPTVMETTLTNRTITLSAPVIAKFWAVVDKQSADDCWPWLGPLNAKGYGRFAANGSVEMAHRSSVRLSGRDIPPGFEVDHICRNRRCVNPSHLRVVTHQENLLSGQTIAAANAAKTHCRKGHPLSTGNLVQGSGKRVCKECRRARSEAEYVPSTDRRRRRHLSSEDVAEVRRRIAAGESHSTIASAMTLSIATISNVRNGKHNYGN
ncbi:MAG: HNH endonuclease [Hyphomicrobium sp.]|nr:HNH endonuclease [Hyphomicrobium sp.]